MKKSYVTERTQFENRTESRLEVKKGDIKIHCSFEVIKKKNTKFETNWKNQSYVSARDAFRECIK